jgi:arylsulfatase A-like enzyme/Flp pilus assembly protein TadD
VALIGLLLAILACGEAAEEAVSESALPAESAQPSHSPASPASGPPNLILITLDTTRADSLGAYGQRRATSPHFDRMAGQGVLFDQASTVIPETLPSHATILTGKWPYSHGVRANAGYVLSERNETLAEHLKKQGYATGVEIAAPVLRKETQITQGFDQYRGAESANVKLKEIRTRGDPTKTLKREMRIGSDITERGIRFVRANRGRKFFLWLHYFDAHSPYSAPRSYNEQVPGSPYHAEVAYQDSQLGLLVKELERLGIANRTLVVVTSDHGEGLREHGEPSHSYFVYETTIRVPLLFWGLDGLPAGRRVGSLVRTLDIAPTVLDLMQLPPLEGIDGVSLRPLLTGAEKDLGLTAYGEATRFYSTFGLNPLRFVREGNLKYIHKVNPELYDVGTDPGELNNLAAERGQDVARLLGKLTDMLRAAPAQHDDAQAAIDSQTAAQLIALGYVAESPAQILEDELATLELSGRDPLELRPDIARLATAPSYMRRGEYAKALEQIEPVVAHHPENVFALNLAGEALMGLERHAEAREHFERALEIDPDDAEVAKNLAIAFDALGEDERALRMLNELADRDPCDRSVQMKLGGMLHDSGRFAAELAAVRDSYERCPALLVTHNNYAWALATLPDDSLRDGTRAVAIMRAAIEQLEKEDGSYLDTLAAAQAEAGQFEEAAQTEEQAIEIVRKAGAPPEVLDKMRSRVERYRAGRPTRDPDPEAA